MSYSYETQRENLFTEEGQRLFLAFRDKAKTLLSQAGAVRLQEIMSNVTITADSWTMLACVDRLVELGELRELPTNGAAQHRVFISAKGN